MNRLYVIESTPSSTGAKADHRCPMQAAMFDGFVRFLASLAGVWGQECRNVDRDVRQPVVK